MPETARLDEHLLSHHPRAASIEHPDFEARREAVVAHREAAEHGKSAIEVEKLFLDHHYHLDFLGYYLYGLFNQNKLPILPKLLRLSQRVVEETWEHWAPAGNRDGSFDRSFNWFAERVLRILSTDRTDIAGSLWANSGNTLDVLKESLEASSALRSALENRDRGRDSRGMLLRLDRLLRDLRKDIALEAVADVAGAVEAAREPAVDTPDEELPDEPPTAGPPRRAVTLRPPPEVATERPPLEVSPALEGLLRKLEAFETLLGRGDTMRAAVIAEDIQQVVDHFDPRLFLPGLFRAYYASLAGNAHLLAMHREQADTPTWRALASLYQVDLDLFLKR